MADKGTPKFEKPLPFLSVERILRIGEVWTYDIAKFYWLI